MTSKFKMAPGMLAHVAKIPAVVVSVSDSRLVAGSVEYEAGNEASHLIQQVSFFPVVPIFMGTLT
jgi:hypothetical protein